MQNPNPGTGDVKPRLTKEQHDILETHFQQQHKPTTNTKKGFAEALGVPLDKINNWFQNRRAKVKQDAKKQAGSYLLFPTNRLSMQSQSLYPPSAAGHCTTTTATTTTRPGVQNYYSGPVGVNASCILPERADIPGVGSQLSQDYTASVLQTIAEMPTMYPYDNLLPTSAPACSLRPVDTASLSGFPGLEPVHNSQTYDTDVAVSLAHPYQNGSTPLYPLDLNGLDGLNFNFDGFSMLPNTSDAVEQAHPDATSANQSLLPTTTPGLSIVSHPVASVTPPQSTPWTGEQASSHNTPANQQDESLSSGFYNLQSDFKADLNSQAMEQWQMATQLTLEQEPRNAVAYDEAPNGIAGSSSNDSNDLFGPGVSPKSKPQPFVNPTADSARRNSSTAGLAEHLNTVVIQPRSSSTSAFRQPNQLSAASSIADRRQQRRPAALSATALRSASYSSGVPASPGTGHNADPEQSLRRIRSSGLQNGRVQKINSGASQRSPLVYTFSEAAASPKFARQASGFANGSLAPPTPLTPSEIGRFPPWQNQAFSRSQSLIEHSSPESLPVSYAMDSSTPGLYSNAASPPTSPLDTLAFNAARFQSEALFRDTPPQSAPATQQTFPRATAMIPVHTVPDFQSPDGSAAMAPKVDHLRRPSLPDAGMFSSLNPQVKPMCAANNECQSYPMPYKADFYEDCLGSSGPSLYVPNFRENRQPTSMPSITVPEFFVHEYTPPQPSGQSNSPRKMQDQPKSYIFANHTSRDFKP